MWCCVVCVCACNAMQCYAMQRNGMYIMLCKAIFYYVMHARM